MTKLLVILSFLLLLAVPIPAPAISCVGAGDVTAIGSCSDGGVTFSNFGVSVAGFSSASIFIGSVPAGTQVLPGGVDLGFQTSQTPTPTTGLADIILKYQVTADAAVLSGVNLVNGGSNVIIQEKVCATPFVGGACAGGLLANLIAAPDSLNKSVAFDSAVASYFVFKDLQFAGTVDDPAFISDFVNSHELTGELAPTPEPATLLLFGSVLTAVGWRLRRRRE